MKAFLTSAQSTQVNLLSPDSLLCLLGNLDTWPQAFSLLFLSQGHLPGCIVVDPAAKSDTTLSTTSAMLRRSLTPDLSMQILALLHSTK